MIRVTLSNIKDLATMGEAIKLSPVVYDQNIFKLVEDVEIELSDGSIFLLQKGFEYDGASVPYIFQWAFPKFGIYSYNSLVHDLCYFLCYQNRKFADKEHFIWGKAVGVKILDNRIRYVFLRAFGWIYWNKSYKKPSFRAKRNRVLTTKIK